MKRFTKTVSLLAASALLALLPDSNALTVSADEPETYTIFFVEEENEWCYLDGSSKNEDDYDDDIEDFYDEVKDGDNVVIFGDKQTETFEIPAYLNSLTVMNCDEFIIVYTNGIGELQAGNGAVVSVSGDIQNAYVHNDAEVTLHGNVNMLTIETDDEADVIGKGTVAHALCINGGNVEFDIYNVAADKLRVDDALLETEDDYYSAAPANTPAATPAPQPNNNAAASDDYDDVPKTGESYTIYLLLAAATLCFAGSRALKRV